MGKNILIVEPREILRKGLRAIFTEDARVSNVYESASVDSLQSQLLRQQVDLIVINQSLVTNLTILPRGHFVILAVEPDITLVKAAYKHGARGYVSENVSSELLRTVLCATEGSFLIERGFFGAKLPRYSLLHRETGGKNACSYGGRCQWTAHPPWQSVKIAYSGPRF